MTLYTLKVNGKRVSNHAYKLEVARVVFQDRAIREILAGNKVRIAPVNMKFWLK